MHGREAFAEFVRPLLAAKLRAIGLDVVYHRGQGDRLYYREPAGQETDGEPGHEVEVLDFVGGFGAGFLGHHHPRIVARARRLLDEGRPFHAQASARGITGQLAARLSERVGRATGRSYVVTFGNSGTEAVEAAIKHAEMERRARLDRVAADMTRTRHEIRQRLRQQSAYLPEQVFDDAARLFGLARVHSLDDLFLGVHRAALDALAAPPAFLAVEGAFHGKTSGSLKLTHRAEYQAPWRSLGPASYFLAEGDTQALSRAIARHTLAYPALAIADDGAVALLERSFVNIAACFLEPIQGEGGIHEIDPDYQRALRRAADQGGFPLVMDEIQSGMGRTGTFLASEAHGVFGDYYLLSKSLGGGMAKISAMMVERGRYLEEFGYLHTSTFADDDFSSAIALEVLDVIDADDGALLAACREKGEYLLSRLRELRARHPGQLREVRGRGLMAGIELELQPGSPAPLMRVLCEQGLLGFLVSGWLLHEHRVRVAPTLSAQTTIRLAPSALIQRADIDHLCHALDDLCTALAASDMFKLTRFLVGRAREPEPPAPVHRPRANAPASGAQSSSAATRVGFLAHFLEPGDIRRWDPSLAPMSEPECERFLERTRGLIEPFVAARTRLVSALGPAVDIAVIGLPFTPAQAVESMRAGSGEWAHELIEGGVELARRMGSSIVGFGGYTSILTSNCRSIVASDLALTSGNSLTAAAALEALFQAADRLGIEERRLGVVGALGNIGMVLAEVALGEVDSLVLVGRGRGEKRLARTARTLAERADRYAGSSARRRAEVPIDIATDLLALRGCTLIISATNSARPIIQAAHIGDHPVVISDVAVPTDVDPGVLRERPRAVVLRGGVVHAPGQQALDIHGMNLAPGEIYGCLAETILLGFAGIGENFSYGPLEAAKVRRIRDLAHMHGFAITENPLSPSE